MTNIRKMQLEVMIRNEVTTNFPRINPHYQRVTSYQIRCYFVKQNTVLPANFVRFVISFGTTRTETPDRPRRKH